MATFAAVGIAAADDPVAGPVAPTSGDSPLVIDLDTASAAKRKSRRARATAAIGQHPRLELSSDSELTAALAAELPAAALSRGTDAAEAAGLAASSGRCREANASAAIGLLELAAAEAGGASVTGSLRTVYAAQFRCAIAANQAGLAILIAQRLRRLGQRAAPDGIDAATWASHPELDASANVTLAEVTINTEPSGAQVWIDHRARGTAPVVVHLPQGKHIVAVAAGAALAATSIDITGWQHSETLKPTPSVGRWTRVNDRVLALRTARRGADATAISEVLSIAGATAALVLLPGGTTEVWRVADSGRVVRVGSRRSEAQAVALLAEGAARRAPDPNVALLRETDAERNARNKAGQDRARWWVYAAIIGAAALGAGVIVFGQTGTDRQRFEITLP